MKKAKANLYDFTRDYDTNLDAELLNMKIRIYDDSFLQSGVVLYEGSIGKFIKERIPSEFIVELLTKLRYEDKVSYRLSGGQNLIERIK